MEAIIILGVLFLVAREYKKQLKYKKYREEWKLNNCSKGKHFVGESAYTDFPFCEICEKEAKIISRAKTASWKW